MKLADLYGEYDATISLGELCLTAIQLRSNGLRTFSGVLDWVGSPSLTCVNAMLKDRFAGYLDRGNLRYLDIYGPELYHVFEERYRITLNHDFYIHLNDPEHLEDYPNIKTKYDRRIARVLDYAASGKKLLFVRTGGTYEEVEQLQEVLSGLVKGEFNVLFVNPSEAFGIVENEWPLSRVCSVDMPPMEQLWQDYAIWKKLLRGIRLRGQ